MTRTILILQHRERIRKFSPTLQHHFVQITVTIDVIKNAVSDEDGHLQKENITLLVNG